MNDAIKVERNRMLRDESLVAADVMMIYYCSFVVLLEYRHKVWPYEYMTLSRRIGELWEPFCKLPFEYPENELELIPPMTFDSVCNTQADEFVAILRQSSLKDEERQVLTEKYLDVWSYVRSGGVSMSLDLHFKKDDVSYAVDYKSGFGSNEKGNTNRLLMVGALYHDLPGKHRNLIFVRQREEQNNNYLQRLKNSGLWDVFCAEAAYAEIQRYTGVDLGTWIASNVTWEEDLAPEFWNYLQEHGLTRYLEW